LERNCEENEQHHWNDESFSRTRIRITARQALDNDLIPAWDIFVLLASSYPFFNLFVQSSINLNPRDPN
jgi:hypothetical protein